MKLKSSICVDIDILHKTGKVISISGKENHIDMDMESEEYKDLCRQYESQIGYLRTDDVDKFDKDLLLLLTEKAKETLKERVDTVIDVYRKVTVNGYLGCIELFGWILDARDISGINIKRYFVNVSKKED